MNETRSPIDSSGELPTFKHTQFPVGCPIVITRVWFNREHRPGIKRSPNEPAPAYIEWYRESIGPTELFYSITSSRETLEQLEELAKRRWLPTRRVPTREPSFAGYTPYLRLVSIREFNRGLAEGRWILE